LAIHNFFVCVKGIRDFSIDEFTNNKPTQHYGIFNNSILDNNILSRISLSEINFFIFKSKCKNIL
jgi:hypothetical protein